jgi:ATP-binding cassette, subfamily B (MDR/TAP), member 8
LLVAVLNIQLPQDLGHLVNGVYKMLQSNVKDYYESIYKPSLKLINLYLAQSLFTFSYIYLLGNMGENISTSLKVNLFNKIIKQDISFYDKTRSGELIDRLTSDIQDFKSSFKMCISQGLKSATQIIGCCVSLYFISPKLTFITSVALPLAILIGNSIPKKIMRFLFSN